MKFNSFICWVIILLFVAGCSKPDKLTFSSHENGQSIAEIETLEAELFEESVVQMGELFVNGETTGITADSTAWKFDFNTTKYDDKGELFFNILCINSDGDSAFSDTLNLIVDNSNSYPKEVNIKDIKLRNKAFNISWEKSTDSDFSKYILERATISTFRNAKIIYQTDKIDNNFYRDKSSNPLIFQYYRIIVIDQIGYETSGDILSSNLERVPSTVNVKSVTYDTTGMMVKWDRSSDKDFKSYTLYHSESKNGKKSKVRTIESKSTTSHKMNKFDPFIENWFWIEVSDKNGYKTLGNSLVSTIEKKPIMSEINLIEYDDNKMEIHWEANLESDFDSFVIVHGEDKNNLNNTIATIYDQGQTSFTITDFDPTVKNWYVIQTKDFWGQIVSSSAKTHKLDLPPKAVEINFLKFNKTAIELSWSKSDEENFSKYTVQHAYSLSDTPDTIAVYLNSGFKSHKIETGFDPNRDNWFWVTVIDSRNQATASTPQTIINNPPDISNLNLSENLIDNMKLNWDQNKASDFKNYKLIHSLDPDMKNREVLMETTDASINSYDFPVFDHGEIHYFMLKVSDIFDIEVSSEIISGIPTDMKALLDIVIENDLNIIPSNLGTQTWENGRLTELSIGDWSDGGGLTIKSVPESIGNLNKLRSLWLSYNELTKLPETIKNLQALQILELRYNQFKEIPESVKEMEELNYLGMSYNKVNIMPDWIGELQSINKLFFSHNQLATVPEDICELNLDYTEIQGFFLSHNKLCSPLFLFPDCIQQYISDQDCQ